MGDQTTIVVPPPGYPKKAFMLGLSKDQTAVLLVEMSVAHPEAEAVPVGNPINITQGFWATLCSLCEDGKPTPVYGNGLHVLDVTVNVIPPELRTPVPQSDLTEVPEFKAPVRKPFALKDLEDKTAL